MTPEETLREQAAALAAREAQQLRETIRALRDELEREWAAASQRLQEALSDTNGEIQVKSFNWSSLEPS